jgi:peptide deformylase
VTEISDYYAILPHVFPHSRIADKERVLSILDILTYPDNFLTKQARTIENIDGALQEIIDNMAETMYDAPGVGLAANQVGVDGKLIVIDPDNEKKNNIYQVLINPKIIESHGETLSEDEGCLSVPGYRSNVRRARSIHVEALDRDGNPFSIEADGYLAIILQHEIDHLSGKLFIDRISALKRNMYKKRVKKSMNQS